MTNRGGYILVVTVLVLSSVLLILATASAFTLVGVQQRDTERRLGVGAQSLAEGCMETALLERRLDSGYAGNETVTIDNQTCTIRPFITGVNPPLTIQTEATKNNRTYRVQVKISDTATMTVQSWERIATWP